MSVWRLLPIGHDEGGQPIYDVGPIVRAGGYFCPNCGAELYFRPSFDAETPSGLSATPDVFSCWECPYSYAE